MKKFDHLSALNTLLDFDTTVMKEELYYPWYIEQTGIFAMAAVWFLISFITITLFFIFSNFGWVALLLFTILTFVLAGGYRCLIKEKQANARVQVIQQTMALEQREFMKAIQPFVPDDQLTVANRIIKEKCFTSDEYTKVTLSSKSQVVTNTDEFVDKVKKIYSAPSQKQRVVKTPEADKGYSEFKFHVPKSAKKKYEELKNKSTFNNELQVTQNVKNAIIKKAYEAANAAALGRELNLVESAIN